MRTLCLLTLTDSMFRANSSQSQAPTMVGVHFFFNFFFGIVQHITRILQIEETVWNREAAWEDLLWYQIPTDF